MSDRPPSPQTRRRTHPDAGSTDVTVVVRDEQGAGSNHHPVDESRWAALVGRVLDDQRVDGPAELSVTFVDEQAMAELNQQFMGQPGPTDVLAFPIDVNVAEERHGHLPQLIGDVVVCPEIAARNAPNHAGSYDDEIALLLVHAILHLFGMDHGDDATRSVMQQREREVLRQHYGALARDPWG